MADGVGFEPTRPLRAYGISSAAPSTELGDPSPRTLCQLRRRSPGSGGPAHRQAPQLLGAGVDRGTVTYDRPMALGPSAPATITVSVIPTNRPCSTTPVIFFSSKPSSSASLIPPSTVRSRIRFPLSVT